VVVKLGDRARMLRVADAERVVAAYRKTIADRDAARAQASAAKTQGGTVDMTAIDGLRAEVRAIGMVQASLAGDLKRMINLLEEVMTRPTVVAAPAPPSKVTAKVESADIVGALLSQAGRAALIGAVGTSLDASTSRQVIREAVMSALGSAEGRAAFRAAIHEALNGYDATKGQAPYRPQAGGRHGG